MEVQSCADPIHRQTVTPAFLPGDFAGQPVKQSTAFFAHTTKAAEDQGRKRTIVNFIYSLGVRSFLLHFVASMSGGKV